MNFPSNISEIEERVKRITPAQYSKTRNFSNGALTYLGPYISRGVISTKYVFNHLTTSNYGWEVIEKLLQELAWRDYWQQVWLAKGDGIFTDLKNEQTPINGQCIPKAILNAKTGINAVDKALEELYITGYMHNHMRMYVASICCNIAKCHWLQPAQWLYSHLLDGDLASNSLSWQWVAGAFSNKKYYANQENINTFFDSTQTHTFLDVGYDEFENLSTPEALLPLESYTPSLNLGSWPSLQLNPKKPCYLYNYYNLDPYWHQHEEANRILLLEPSFFEQFPIQQKTFDFAIQLAQNIKNIQVFVDSFANFEKQVAPQTIIFKEHPLCTHYKGIEESRDWLTSVTGYYPSFFKFWKLAKKELIA